MLNIAVLQMLGLKDCVSEESASSSQFCFFEEPK